MRNINFSFLARDAILCARYLTKLEEANAALEQMYDRDSKLIGIDIETGKTHPENNMSGLDPHMSFIRLIQLYDGKDLLVIDMKGIPEPPKFLEAILERSTLVAHNAIFEIKHLWHHYSRPKDIHCSMLMANFINNAEHSPYEPAEEDEFGNEKPRFNRSVSLADLTKQILGVRISKVHQTSDWNAEHLSKEQIVYAAIDAIATYDLAKHYAPKINKYKLQKSYQLYRRMMHVIAEMELSGIEVDVDAHNKLINDWTEQKAKAEQKCKKYFGNVNLRSSKQLHNWVLRTYSNDKRMLATWPKTEKGQYSFNKIKLSEFQGLPAVGAILEYKKYATLLSTFGKSLQDKLSPVTKRLHCNFSLGETRTGRLSSRNPNLQNMPARNDSFRHIFVAAPGCKLVVADFSQVEIRVAGELSRDPRILSAYANGMDLHSGIVSELSGKDIADVSKAERQLGKAINFGLQFGMGPNKLADYAKASYGVEMSDKEAANAYEVYHKKYAVYSAWSDIQREKCQKIGYVRTPMGRMRKLMEMETYTKAVNTPVQGGAAEVSFASLIKLQDRLQDEDLDGHIDILNTVHDEIVLEATLDYVDKAAEILQWAMEQGMLELFPTATTQGLVEVATGDTWAEAK